MAEQLTDAAQSDRTPAAAKGIAAGAAVIAAALAGLPGTPGVYRMIGAKGEVLYVGKARSLRKRVASYTNVARLPERLRRMVARTL